MSYKIAAFYRFVEIADTAALRAAIMDFCANTPSMCGTILLAPEGINATIGAFPDELDRVIEYLNAQAGIKQGELKYSTASQKPFNRFKVRLKKEIITLRRPEANPAKLVGTYVAPADWNALLADPEVVLIDTRNDYETKLGIFKNAIDPQLKIFTEFPEWVKKNLNPDQHKKIAMFCTGGIRCEKASALMLQEGFENVYHLKGGILQYLEDVTEEQSLWDGECFVFDKRVAVSHGLKEGNAALCYACREPLTADEIAHSAYEKGVSCPYCIEKLTPHRAAMLRQRQQEFLNPDHDGLQ